MFPHVNSETISLPRYLCPEDPATKLSAKMGLAEKWVTGKSFAKGKSNSGPNAEPWDTPVVTILVSELAGVTRK